MILANKIEELKREGNAGIAEIDALEEKLKEIEHRRETLESANEENAEVLGSNGG